MLRGRPAGAGGRVDRRAESVVRFLVDPDDEQGPVREAGGGGAVLSDAQEEPDDRGLVQPEIRVEVAVGAEPPVAEGVPDVPGPDGLAVQADQVVGHRSDLAGPLLDDRGRNVGIT